MKKKTLFIFILSILLFVPLTMAAMQDVEPTSRIEITGVNATGLPTVEVTANVVDAFGKPVAGLGVDDFVITGDLAEIARIVSVENITADDLSFATVLVIDVSTSMDGLPFQEAQAAARQYIELSRPEDPIAIVTFATTARVVQPFTTDKDVLLTTIDQLAYGGQTALYDAALLGVREANNQELTRRAVVLLSDGAEYNKDRGVSSVSSRESALDEATIRGVPVYTIGLGYGVDRTYLEDLAFGTNARNFESPTPDELTEVYTQISELLRSQYVVTIEVDVPPDGTEYDLGVEVAIPDDITVAANTTLRAPILAPIITAPTLPDTPISEVTDIVLNIAADDPILAPTASIDGVDAGGTFDPETNTYSLTIDPLQFAPGSYALEMSVTDTDQTGAEDDTTTFSDTFTIAALAPDVTVNLPLNEDGTLSEPATVTLVTGGQTPVTQASYAVGEDDPTVVTEGPDYAYTVDPFDYAPGEYNLSVAVTNEGGTTTTVSQNFTIAALAPQVSVPEIDPDTEIADPFDVTISASGQTPIASIGAGIGGIEYAAVEEADSATFTINPVELQPGSQTFTYSVTDTSGETTSGSFPVTIAALPPVVSVDIPVDETGEISETTTVTVDASGQTSISGVAFAFGEDAPVNVTLAPYTYTIDPAAYAPGDYTLEVTVNNSGGQSTTVSETVTIAALPPVISISGLIDNDLLVDPVDVTVTTDSQTPVTGVSVSYDGGDAEAVEDGTFTIDIDALGGGTHTLQIVAENEGGQSSTADFSFEVQLPTLTPTDTVEPSETPIPPSEVPTLVPASDTPVPASDTPEPATEAAVVPSDTVVPPTDTVEPTETDVPPTDTVEPTETDVPPSETPTEEPTSEDVAVQPSEAPSETPSDEPSATVTPTDTEEPPTATNTAEATDEVTAAVESSREPEATLTPIGEIIESQAENPPAEQNNTTMIAIICGGGLLILIALFLVFGRRNDDE